MEGKEQKYDMKICNNCNTTNPDEAQFCKECGQRLSIVKEPNSQFTLDKFKDIEFIPKSEYKMQIVRKCKRWFFSVLFLFCLRMICPIILGILDITDYWDMEGATSSLNIMASICGVFLILTALGFLCVLISTINRSMRLEKNADYIEKNLFMNNYRRIAKDLKMGLINSEDKILLTPRFDYVESYNIRYLKITSNEKCGLYDLDFKKIILGTDYSNIENLKGSELYILRKDEFKGVYNPKINKAIVPAKYLTCKVRGSVIEAVDSSGNKDHFDFYGHRLK